MYFGWYVKDGEFSFKKIHVDFSYPLLLNFKKK